jgi:hypothetical protein
MERIKVKGRIHGVLTPAQKRRLKRQRARIAQELPDLIRRNQLAHAARKERTFSGALRRAVHGSSWSPANLAAKAEIDWSDLDDFLTAEGTLPSDAIDRLVKVLKVKLPTTRSRGAAKAG